MASHARGIRHSLPLPFLGDFLVRRLGHRKVIIASKKI